MIIAGFGFSSRATRASLAEAFAALRGRPDKLVTLKARAQSDLFQAFAKAQNITVLGLDESEISGVETPSQSPRIQARFNTGSVAEAAALVAARGTGATTARLIQTRYVTTDGLATVALAEMIER